MANLGISGCSAPRTTMSRLLVRQSRPHTSRSSVGCRVLLLTACAALLQAAGLLSNSCFAASYLSSSVGQQTRRTELAGTSAQATLRGRSVRMGQVERHALPEGLEVVLDIVNAVPQQVASFGPMGAVYFFVIYVIAECVALPATPLTLSAGYLFGLPQGIALTVLAGSTAAAIAFTLSRTFLRPQIEKIAAGNEQFQRINTAVEKEGFKIIALLRLSPLLPFSISNYVFGLSNVGFKDFLAATVVGFTPGTAALITLSSTVREAAMASEEGTSQPWYLYAIGILFTFGLLKLATDIAKEAVDEAVDGGQPMAKDVVNQANAR